MKPTTRSMFPGYCRYEVVRYGRLLTRRPALHVNINVYYQWTQQLFIFRDQLKTYICVFFFPSFVVHDTLPLPPTRCVRSVTCGKTESFHLKNVFATHSKYPVHNLALCDKIFMEQSCIRSKLWINAVPLWSRQWVNKSKQLLYALLDCSLSKWLTATVRLNRDAEGSCTRCSENCSVYVQITALSQVRRLEIWENYHLKDFSIPRMTQNIRNNRLSLFFCVWLEQSDVSWSFRNTDGSLYEV